MIQIITDSGADLPQNIIKKYNIHVVPLTVNIDGKEYFDGINITSHEFYEKMAAAKTLPKTSQPPAATFVRVFKSLASRGELLCINMSSKLSGTYQTACLAREMAGIDVAVFDSWAATLRQGLQVIKAAMLAEKGLSRTEIINKLTAYRNNMTIYVLLGTLENIVKWGRLSKFKGSLARILNIRILLTGVEGSVVMLEKIHGKKKTLQRILERMNDTLQGAKDLSTRYFSIAHCDNPKDAELLKNAMMENFQPCDVIVNDMGSTIATYAGQGGMVISF